MVETKKMTMDVPTVDVMTRECHGSKVGVMRGGMPLDASAENASSRAAVVRRYAAEASIEKRVVDAEVWTVSVAAVSALRHHKAVRVP